MGGSFKSATVAKDAQPDPFSFTAQTNVALSAVVESNTVTVKGINAPSPVSVVGGEYRINGGTYASATGNVNNGDTVQVRHTSANKSTTAVTTTLTIGGVVGSFKSTTADIIPNAFSFTAQANVARAAVVVSNAITVGGITAPAPISVAGGEYSINGGAYTSTVGTVSNGAKVTVRHTVSASFSSAVTTTLTIGGVGGSFKSTTTANTKPIANAVTATTYDDSAYPITLVGTDADGDNLTYLKVTAPAHGSLSISGNIATYKPTPNYSGAADSFTYKVNDGKADSNTATVSITLSPCPLPSKDRQGRSLNGLSCNDKAMLDFFEVKTVPLLESQITEANNQTIPVVNENSVKLHYPQIP